MHSKLSPTFSLFLSSLAPAFLKRRAARFYNNHQCQLKSDCEEKKQFAHPEKHVNC